MSTELLAAVNVRKSYRGQLALAINELRLMAGELILLTGPNGAGKTTLLRILAGFVKPDGGTRFRVAGQPVAHPTPGTDCGYLHQKPYLFDTSVRANLEFGLGSDQPNGRARAAAILAICNLDCDEDQPADELSGGQRQLLTLARLCLAKAPVLLLDEPTAGLDEQGCQAVESLLREVQDAGRAVLMSSHDERINRTLSPAGIIHIAAGRIECRGETDYESTA